MVGRCVHNDILIVVILLKFYYKLNNNPHHWMLGPTEAAAVVLSSGTGNGPRRKWVYGLAYTSFLNPVGSDTWRTIEGPGTGANRMSTSKTITPGIRGGMNRKSTVQGDDPTIQFNSIQKMICIALHYE